MCSWQSCTSISKKIFTNKQLLIIYINLKSKTTMHVKYWKAHQISPCQSIQLLYDSCSQISQPQVYWLANFLPSWLHISPSLNEFQFFSPSPSTITAYARKSLQLSYSLENKYFIFIYESDSKNFHKCRNTHKKDLTMLLPDWRNHITIWSWNVKKSKKSNGRFKLGTWT